MNYLMANINKSKYVNREDNLSAFFTHYIKVPPYIKKYI